MRRSIFCILTLSYTYFNFCSHFNLTNWLMRFLWKRIKWRKNHWYLDYSWRKAMWFFMLIYLTGLFLSPIDWVFGLSSQHLLWNYLGAWKMQYFWIIYLQLCAYMMYNEEDSIWGLEIYEVNDWWRLTWIVLIRLYLVRFFRLINRYI